MHVLESLQSAAVTKLNIGIVNMTHLGTFKVFDAKSVHRNGGNTNSLAIVKNLTNLVKALLVRAL